jgi:hypothetical protein
MTTMKFVLPPASQCFQDCYMPHLSPATSFAPYQMVLQTTTEDINEQRVGEEALSRALSFVEVEA